MPRVALGSAVKSAIVIGGGVAGIAAAIRLSEHGVRVTLLEASRRLGGRASGFTDPVLGEIDRGQHVTMGCCDHHIDLMQRLDVAHCWAFGRTQTWVSRDGRRSLIQPSMLPPPAHFSIAFVTARFLSIAERANLGIAGLRLLAAKPEPSETFGALLRRTGHAESVIRKLWTPVAVGACNLAPDQLSARVAMYVLRTGFFGDPAASAIGVATVPLERLYDRVPELVADAGGDVRLGARVEAFDGQSATLRTGETVSADRVICALAPRHASRLVGERARDERFDRMDKLGSSAIVCVHLLFDRPLMDEPHLVLVDRFTHWFFRGGSGERVAAVISAADEIASKSDDEMVEHVLEDAGAVLPGVVGATLVRGRAVREKHATFAATPESDHLRPACDGPSGVLLAGDYTDTGWPATMESATRSGYRCAELALGLYEGGLSP